MAYGGNKKISALRRRFIHQDGITIVDLTVGHFSILFYEVASSQIYPQCLWSKHSVAQKAHAKSFPLCVAKLVPILRTTKKRRNKYCYFM